MSRFDHFPAATSANRLRGCRVSSTFCWALIFYAAVLLTNRFEDAPTDPTFVQGDSLSYLAMAEAVPGLPSDSIGFQYAQRIAIPYVLGGIKRLVPVPPHRLFQAAVVLLQLAILFLVCRLLARLGLQRNQALIVIAVLVFNPWAFRFYLTYPEMVNDVGFVAGLALVLDGLLKGSGPAVLSGQLLASLSRQTGLLLLPMTLLWIARGTAPWSTLPRGTRLAWCTAAAAIAAGVYLTTGQIASLFAGPSDNGAHLVGLIDWAINDFDTPTLIIFGARMVVAPALALVLLHGVARRRHGSTGPTMVLWCGTLCLWAQPLIAGPAITAGSGPRLVALGLLPLVLILAIRLRESGAFAPDQSWRVGATLALLAMGSFHHQFAAVLPGLDRLMFGMTYATVCVGILLLTPTQRQTSRGVVDG